MPDFWLRYRQGDQMRWCKNRQRFTKKAQITKYSPPKRRYRSSKKVPVSSIQAKKKCDRPPKIAVLVL